MLLLVPETAENKNQDTCHSTPVVSPGAYAKNWLIAME